MRANQPSLFPGFPPLNPTTESIKYAGSKLKLLPHILTLAASLPATSILDGFSGTTRVSQAFAQSGYRVMCNDISAWSKVFGTCYLQANRTLSYYNELIAHLNAAAPIDGWFTAHYGGKAETKSSVQSSGLKKPWQIHNTRKLDGIRAEIDCMALDDIDKSVALTSLILALDRVDSTLGHFVSYLQDWSPRSYNPLYLQVPKLLYQDEWHEVSQADIFDCLDRWQGDLAYFDPPYGSNNEKMPPSRVRYASYYHLWTTICLNDRPNLTGKALRREDTSDTIAGSVFEEFRRDSNGDFIAIQAIAKILQVVKAKWVILSYNSGGRATAQDLNALLLSNGKILKVIEIDYKRNVMASMKWTDEWLRDTEEPNREFLFLLEK